MAMDGERVQDILHRGLGRAGRAVGQWCELLRPRGLSDPLDGGNLVLRLQAAFSAPGGRFARPVAHGGVLWHGIFDAAYTRVGDYLRQRESRPGARDGGVWFIAAQQPLSPVLCVRASRVVDVLRAAGPGLPGIGGYGGTAAPAVVMAGWPAGVLAGGGGGGLAGLPDEVAGAGWTVLLPAPGGVVLRPGDLLRDDLGRQGVVAGAELSALGWRLRVRQEAG